MEVKLPTVSVWAMECGILYPFLVRRASVEEAVAGPKDLEARQSCGEIA